MPALGMPFVEDNGRVTRRTFAREGLAATSVANISFSSEDWPDIRTIEPDLLTPGISLGDVAPGKRIRQSLPEYESTEVHHTLYLPVDWQRGKRYPVIVEYAGNGNYKNNFGDVSTGTVEGSNLGYGISGGKGFLWLCLPYVNRQQSRNEVLWWGDPEATVEYCKRAVKLVCESHGGDRSKVILAGFSRGAIACNYIGLRDDEIAALWRGFIPYSHYDGVRRWPYEDSDSASALVRLKRLLSRPQFIIHENPLMRRADTCSALKLVPRSLFVHSNSATTMTAGRCATSRNAAKSGRGFGV
jgi:hypothetical protein